MSLLAGPVLARADFDKKGLELGGAVLTRCGGQPWRFDTAYYLAARGENERAPDALPKTPWEAELREAMAGHARVEEEQLLEVLLGDLAASPNAS